MAKQKIQPGQWKSRIVGHAKVAPDQLVANPLNFRTHPMRQREALKAAIEDMGFVRSVLVNKRTGNLVDGHERVWQALTSEQPTIDVEYIDVSEEEERKILATLDPIGELANRAVLNRLIAGDESAFISITQCPRSCGNEHGFSSRK